MSAPYVADRLVIGSLLSANWTGTPVWWPNERFVAPEPAGNPASPAAYLAFEIAYDSAEQITLGGDYEVRGRAELGVWVEKGCGDAILRGYIDSLYSIFAAVNSPGIFFFEPLLGDAETEPEWDWYGRLVSVPFAHFGALSAAEVATLAGVSGSTRTISQAGHGLAVKDWVGFNGSAWVKVTATAGQPRCDGVVSAVVDSSTFVLSPVGPVTITGHGYTLGPLYLSQGTAGTVTSTQPSSGIVQQMAVAYDANSLIVLSLPQVER